MTFKVSGHIKSWGLRVGRDEMFIFDTWTTKLNWVISLYQLWWELTLILTSKANTPIYSALLLILSDFRVRTRLHAKSLFPMDLCCIELNKCVPWMFRKFEVTIEYVYRGSLNGSANSNHSSTPTPQNAINYSAAIPTESTASVSVPKLELWRWKQCGLKTWWFDVTDFKFITFVCSLPERLMFG